MSPLFSIQKRNGQLSPFQQEKITEAIWKAVQSVGGTDRTLAEKISDQITTVLEVKYKDGGNPAVEEIQDTVEKILIEGGHAKTAKAYILYRDERNKIREAQRKILHGRTTKLPFTLNALRVLAARYLVRDEEGELSEGPDQMFERVAKALAEIDKTYNYSDEERAELQKNFQEVMDTFEFIPAGRTLANAGGPTRVVSNCIVLHFKDSMDDIFGTLRDAALLQQAGSGLGFAWHLLRPAGTFTKRTRGNASGPVSFLQAFNKAFGVIKQQGRHGANMGVMRVDHPDILEFIECKWNEGELVNFNISVSLTDAFMQEVKENSKEPWMCEFNGEKMKPRRIVRNSRGAVVEVIEETLTAGQIMDRIISAAWRNGEPGVLFPDAANKYNPVPGLGRLEATNPCGEQWLHDGDVCNLGSINLSKFVKDGKIDEERLKFVTRMSTHMLDNVIDISDFPVEKVNTTFRNNRRVGLGIMGFADMLYQMGIAYDSSEGREVGRYVMKLINDTSAEYSTQLGERKGVFPNWDISIYGSKGKNIKRRNSALTTVAPTGSISMLFDCSSGVEPFFALSYYKEVLGGQRLPYLNPYLEKALKDRNLYTEEIMEEIIKTGSIQNIDAIPTEMKKIFVTAMDISADAHIEMQAAFQENVENSISKTINFPNTATQEDVRQGYIKAWEMGCKGCTVYRDGSRQEQVLNLNKDVKKEDDAARDIPIESLEEPREHQSIKEADLTDKKALIQSKICPECKGKIRVEEGCVSCVSCGFSACAL